MTLASIQLLLLVVVVLVVVSRNGRGRDGERKIGAGMTRCVGGKGKWEGEEMVIVRDGWKRDVPDDWCFTACIALLRPF